MLCVIAAVSTASVERARPKSSSFTLPPGASSQMFAGLMSRCTSAFACAAANPSAVSRAILVAAFSPGAPFFLR